MGDVGERQEAEGGCRLTRVVLAVQGEYHLDGGRNVMGERQEAGVAARWYCRDSTMGWGHVHGEWHSTGEL